MAQAFRNNRPLQQFVLTGVTPTGRVLGTGSYGSVEEVSSYTSASSFPILYICLGNLQASCVCWQEAP